MNTQAHQLWNVVAKRYSDDLQLIGEYWEEINAAYNEPHRHYHNTRHIEFMLEQSEEIKNHIQSFHTFLAAIFYHDFVYDVHRKDNEERSAEVAVKRLNKLSFPNDEVDHCKKMILATKGHLLSTDNDTNYLIDIDLAIMGQDEKTYREYVSNIRKEYSFYPDAEFGVARKAIIKEFLFRKQIFNTGYFFEKYEDKARRNLRKGYLVRST